MPESEKADQLTKKLGIYVRTAKMILYLHELKGKCQLLRSTHIVTSFASALPN